jgi:hypothetical protein
VLLVLPKPADPTSPTLLHCKHFPIAAPSSPKHSGAPGKAAKLVAGLLFPPSQKLQSPLAIPSSPKNSGASPGKATTMAARLPPSAATSSCGPTSLVGASPGAPSAAASGFPLMVSTLSFKEVASCQGSLSGLHASIPKVASLQGHPSRMNAVVPEAPTVSIPMSQEALTYARHYKRHALVCRFNLFLPSLPDLISWFSSEWYPFLDREVIPCPFAKGFFVVVFYSTSDRDKVFNLGPWFWGRAGLPMQLWTPAFDPSMDCIPSTPVWVRLSYLPLHLWGDESLHSIGNGLGKFLCRSPDSKPSRSTFTRIYVEMDFHKGFPAEIILQGKDYSRTQKLDYENLSFRCRNYFETGHLARNCGKPPGKKRSSKPN